MPRRTLNYKSILIMSYGRTGSTLLNGILNLIDGCLINGENCNFIYGLFQSYKSLRATKKHKGADAICPWFGAQRINLDIYLSSLSQLIKQQLLGMQIQNQEIQCYGFKEVRYLKRFDANPENIQKSSFVRPGDLAEYVLFLERVFPEVALIVNTRSHDEVLSSGWWRRRNKNLSPSEHQKELQKRRMHLEDFEKLLLETLEPRGNSFHITYKDIVGNGDRLAQLFDFLGADFDQHVTKEIIAIKHSYNPNPLNSLNTARKIAT